jgi:S-DNA-T family DNA segregation ATPase FtsK/SpoIIIE
MNVNVTESQAIIKRLSDLSAELGLIPPGRVWEDPLPDRLYLPILFESEFNPVSWDGNGWQVQAPKNIDVLVGLYDDPLHQSQPIFRTCQSGSSGHLLVFGSSGAGKSTFLITFALSLAMMASPEQVNIYCLDFGKQNSLEILKGLPHLPINGGVIVENENEKINRLLAMIRNEISQRVGLFQARRVGEITSFNASVSKKQQLPLVYILIDSLNKQFTQNNLGFAEQLEEIIRAGRSVGFHVIITANQTRDVPSTFLTDISEKIVLLHGHSAETSSILGLQSKGLARKLEMEQIPPGRAMINQFPILEMQVALPVSGLDDLIQSMNLRKLIDSMAKSWKHHRPLNIDILPNFISYGNTFSINEISHVIRNTSDIEVPIGIGHNSLEPVTLSINRDGPYFLIASSDSKLGKTTFIQTWLLSLSQNYSSESLQFIIIDYHSRSLRHLSTLPNVSNYIPIKRDLPSALENLEKIIVDREQALEKSYYHNPIEFNEETFIRKLGYIVVVIDDFDSFRSKSPQENTRLGNCLQNGEGLGLRIIIAENAAMISPGSDNILRRALRFGCGVLLGGSDHLHLFNNVKVPYGQKTFNLPPGRGYLINRGQVQLFQSLAFWKFSADDKDTKNEQIKQWIKKIEKGN